MATEQDLQDILKAKKEEFGTWRGLGDWLGVSKQKAWDLANGHKNISPVFARKLGYKLIRTRTYEEISDHRSGTNGREV